MPSFGTFVFSVACILYVTALLFFTQPGRRVLEWLGLYTECTADVSLLRKSCLPRQQR
jgi:hypothetical protein